MENRDSRKNPQPIGREGRGPGEYLSCTSYTVDNKTGNIYIRGKREAILVYSPNGDFIREFQLPHSDDGSVFGDIEFLDSSLFIAQYISMGNAQYNWIITDTLRINKITCPLLSPKRETSVVSLNIEIKYLTGTSITIQSLPYLPILVTGNHAFSHLGTTDVIRRISNLIPLNNI